MTRGQHPALPDPVAVVRELLDGWTPAGPDPAEEAETVEFFRSELGWTDDDFDVEQLRAWRIDYGAPATDDEARDQLAAAITDVLHEVASIPGPRNWRRWRATGRLSMLLYASGLSYGGGSLSWGRHDPFGVVYTLPRLSSFKPGQRPYLLWMSREVRYCLRMQVDYAVHGHQPPGGWHRPGSADVYGICGRCAPWHCCDSTTTEHAPGCPEEDAA